MKKETVLNKKPFKQRIKKDLKSNWVLYLIALVPIIWFLIFSYGPMFGLIMAFQKFDVSKGFFNSEWVGLENFKNFFQLPFSMRIIGNTFIYGLLDIIFVFPAPIILALLLNSVHKKAFRRSFQTAVYLPYFISLTVVTGIIKDFTIGNGFINVAFQNLGLLAENQSMYTNPDWFRPIVVFSNIWQTIGFSSIIYIAALSAIDKTLYEASSMDGAGKFKQLIHVTIPSILPIILIMLVLRVSTILNVNAEKLILLRSGTTIDVAETISTYVYQLIFSESYSVKQYGLSTAIGLMNSIASFSLLIFSNRISRRLNERSLF